MKTQILSMFLVSLTAVAACTTPNQATAWQTLTLIQAKPTLVEVADDDGAREHGEKMFFEAKLSDQSGKAVGQLLGKHVIVDIPGDDGVGDAAVEERFTTMAIVFEDGDEIMVQGANVYPVNERIMQANAPQIRVVIGGTGKFKGVRGQVKTTRNEDETYTHTVEYRLD
jgi:hypothetical protein